VATLVLLALGPVAALPFVLIHGLGNGLLTIVRGTLPLAIFGAAGYGARQGWIALPGRIVGALSPWLFGLALQSWGVGALVAFGLGGPGRFCPAAGFAPARRLMSPRRQNAAQATTTGLLSPPDHGPLHDLAGRTTRRRL
jgi:hypothetical protein